MKWWHKSEVRQNKESDTSSLYSSVIPSLQMGPQRVVTLRRGLRDAGLKDISHGAPQTFISARSTLQSGKKSISLGAPGKGYGIRFSSLASSPPCHPPGPSQKKTKKTSGNSRRKRLKMEEKGHVTSWRRKVILPFLWGCLSVGTAQNLMYPSVPSPITHFPSSPLLCSSSVHTVFNFFFLLLLSTSSIPPVALLSSSSE